MNSWTQPGDGFFKETITEGIKVNNQPDNPNDRVGSAVDRHKEYSHIYVSKMDKELAEVFIDEKLLVELLNGRIYPGSKILQYLDNKKIWGKIGKQKNDVQWKRNELIITNSKLRSLGTNQMDIVMVSRAIAKWIESYGPSKAVIGSVLHLQR